MAKQNNPAPATTKTPASAPKAKNVQTLDLDQTEGKERKPRTEDIVYFVEVVDLKTQAGRDRAAELASMQSGVLHYVLPGQPATFRKQNKAGELYGSEMVGAVGWLQANAKSKGWAGKAVKRIKENADNTTWSLKASANTADLKVD